MPLAKTLEGLPDAPYALPTIEALALLDVSAAIGLSDEEVKRRAQAYGPNAIVSRRRTSAFVVLAHQFQSPVVYLLAAAAALAFYFGELEEGSAIAAVLAINALIGFLTELKAARSIEALRGLATAWPVSAATGIPASSRPTKWCPAISYWWRPATRSQRTCGWSRPPTSAPMNRP